jgi:hypothetical protein
MNPNYGYQLYQAQRIMTRAEVLAGDARRGRSSAASRRGGRAAVRRARARGIMALNIIAGRADGAARTGRPGHGQGTARVGETPGRDGTEAHSACLPEADPDPGERILTGTGEPGRMSDRVTFQ